MNPSVIQILLHIGTLVSDVKDVEQLVSDLLKKQPVKEDLLKFVADVGGLFASSLLPLPRGMAQADIAAAFSSLESAVQAL